MRNYEDIKYEQWKDYVEATLPGLLKRNLLVKRHIPQTVPATPQHNASMAALEDNPERKSMVEIQG